MKFTIVYDNETLRGDLKPAHGFSAWIYADGENILFDTGWDGSVLLQNMSKLGLNPSDLDSVVLSHQHWDHFGGLTHLFEKSKSLIVYSPKSFSEYLKREISERAELVEVDGLIEITDSITSLGEIEGEFRGQKLYEQALACKTKSGNIVMVGCSHPGVDYILAKADSLGKVSGIIGGFHGFNQLEALEDLNLIIPSHCTKAKKEIQSRFPDKSEKSGVGLILTL
ncbi:MAG: MBL fold metallo-hydrolase [Methanobacteriota archaeon]